MAIDPLSSEGMVILILQIFTISCKFLIATYFWRYWKTSKGKMNVAFEDNQDFIYSKTLSVVFYGLFFSRIFFFIFDFYLTKFNTALYFLPLNIWFWKLGVIISEIAALYFVYQMDKMIFQFKSKKFPEYLIIFLMAFTLIYPVTDWQGFQNLSMLSILPFIPIGILVIFYSRFGIQAGGPIRRNVLIILTSFSFYGIAGLMVNSGVIDLLNRTTNYSWELSCYILQAVFKVIGLLLLLKLTRKKQPPKIWLKNLWIVDNYSGICIFEANFSKNSTDSTLISGFFTAIRSFGQEITTTSLMGIIFEKITMYFRNENRYYIVAATTDEVSRFDVDEFLVEISSVFLKKYGQFLDNWGGNIQLFSDFQTEIEKLTNKQPLNVDLVLSAQMFKPIHK